MFLRIVALSLALLAPLPALATGEIESLITDADRERLAKFDAAKTEALATARKGGSPDGLAALTSVLSAEPVSFEGFDMTGEWQCRTIKAGGLAELVVYSWFRCQVTDDGSGWRLEKLTGSQRTTGRFFTDSDTRLAYLGSGSVNDDPAPGYGSGPRSDQVGYTYRTGPDEWYIAFPFPYYESRFDVLQFRR